MIIKWFVERYVCSTTDPVSFTLAPPNQPYIMYHFLLKGSDCKLVSAITEQRQIKRNFAYCEAEVLINEVLLSIQLIWSHKSDILTRCGQLQRKKGRGRENKQYKKRKLGKSSYTV